MVRASHCRIFILTAPVMIPTLYATLLTFSAVAEAGTSPFNYIATGSFELSAFFFPDGTEGTSITLEGPSTSRPITVHEWASGKGKTIGRCTPPGGKPNTGLKYTYTDSLEIITFKATGDFLIQNLVSGTQCFNIRAPFPIPFNGTLIVRNVGGTGKFAGATGTETLNFSGQYLSCNTGCIGYVRHDETGNVTTP
jgi:hypothetical protein